MAERSAEDSDAVDLGYARVDAQPDPGAMVAGMEAIARWPAVQRLRRWERGHLALQPGDRLLDIGCGTADVTYALAADVAPGGEVVGIDASEAMIAAARRRAPSAPAPVRLVLGDARDLDEPDGSFAAVRAERVLQWLPRPAEAVADMVRLLAPGGRLSLIDTDWRTFVLDLPATSGVSELPAAMLRLNDGATAGSRLLNLCRDAGLQQLECTGAAHVATTWDPGHDPAPAGFPPIFEFAAYLVEHQAIDADVARRAVAALVDAARADRFFASLSMFAVSGVKP
jgi:SAM-dependent methyltransferase